MPAERPVSKASENRRATKPIMEKRRRARINQCLSELKTLILDALNKDPSRHSKLEKADILEMTVRHLQNIQRQQMAAAISTDSSVLNKFKAGFNECASEVTRYVSRIEGVDPALKQRLLSHLSSCLSGMNSSASPFQPQSAFPQAAMLHSLSVQIPAVGIVPAGRASSDINNNTNGNATGKMFAGLSVIPGRLPNGDFAFLLPSGSHPTMAAAFQLPSTSSTGPERSSSQSSWPSSKRSASPEPMSDTDNAVLSPTCSDAGSDVFLEPQHKPQQQHAVTPRSPSPPRQHHPGLVPRHLPLSSDPDSVWRPW